MKDLLRLLFAFILTGFFVADASAAKPKILLLKDLEPGTEAIGFSVFKGVEPQSFRVVLGEAIDQSGSNFVLARISGNPMDTPLEKIGAISGMSGSPVFIGCNDLDDCVNNGTLVGALSYGIGYFIEGGMNCLLTPAEYMLGVRNGGYAVAPDFYSSPPSEIIVNKKKFINLLLFPKMENLSVAGNSGGRCKESIKSDIKPGSMVSVFLATGAINVGVSGTVTWRDENNVYIFGHPLNGTGMVRYPFVQVSVADTLQTPAGALKMTGCYLDTKGVMLVDGAFEMSGVIGGTAPMLPYQVELHMGNNSVATLSEEIAASPMAGTIIQKLPAIWAEQLFGNLSHFSIAYQFRITIVDQPEIFVKNIIPAQIRQAYNPLPEPKNLLERKISFEEVFNRVYRPLQIMKESGFNYGVESIKVHMDVIKVFKLWTAKKSFLSQKKASPGETVYANIILEESPGSTTKQISIPVKIPDDFLERTKSGASSNTTVLVQGGSKFTDKREVEEITSIGDIIKQLNQSMNYKTNVLYVQQIMPRPKAEEEIDIANTKTSVKPAWKWTDIGENDLKQLPRNNKNEVVLTLSPPLDDFIDLNLSFELQVELKKDETESENKTKRKKWLPLFFF
jgi:hypothetical protein